MSELPPLRTEIPAALWKAYRVDLLQLAAEIRAVTDLRELRSVCHKLGGAAGVYGLPKLQKAAVALEQSARTVVDEPLRMQLLETIKHTIRAIDQLD
jgi:HPt (histidine-containing phosphotransfer) domain-containing protein